MELPEDKVHHMNSKSQDGVPDNTYLRELNEATLLHNVRTWYNDKKDDGGCYSVTGHILIAVNPFRPLKIYEESNVSTLLPRSRWPAASRPALPSHGRAQALPHRRHACIKRARCTPRACARVAVALVALLISEWLAKRVRDSGRNRE